MTIADYIEELSKFPPNTPIFNFYAGGHGPVEVDSPLKLKLARIEKLQWGHRFSWDGNNEKSFDALIL